MNATGWRKACWKGHHIKKNETETAQRHLMRSPSSHCLFLQRTNWNNAAPACYYRHQASIIQANVTGVTVLVCVATYSIWHQDSSSSEKHEEQEFQVWFWTFNSHVVSVGVLFQQFLYIYQAYLKSNNVLNKYKDKYGWMVGGVLNHYFLLRASR